MIRRGGLVSAWLVGTLCCIVATPVLWSLGAAVLRTPARVSVRHLPPMALLALLGALVLVHRRHWWAGVARALWPVVGVGAVWAGAHVISVASASMEPGTFVYAVSSLGVLGTLVGATVVLAGSPEARAWLGWTAGALVGVYALFFVIGLVWPGAVPLAFERLDHQHVGHWPRYAGIIGVPVLAGVMLLTLAGLAGGIPRRRWRECAVGASLVLAAATVSFVTLVLPLLLVWRFVDRARWRYLLTALLVIGALVPLYVKPLELRAADRVFALGSVHEAYHEGGLGPRLMPIQTVTLGGLELDLHFNAYFYLVGNALDCWRRHPALGTGIGVRDACPTRLMTTNGTWYNPVPHNGYLRVLARLGLVGALAGIALLWLITRRYRWREDRWRDAAIVAVATCGIATDQWASLPLAALVATGLGGGPVTPSGADVAVDAARAMP